ncbi:MAG: NADPH-dependent 2,4-dienoyl-CoA reductase, partial [Pseudomonadota bacterium]
AERGAFASYYGISEDLNTRGCIDPDLRKAPFARREIIILQRSAGRLGKSLSITTDWIKRERLSGSGVRFLSGVTYKKIDDDGLHIETEKGPDIIPADTIVLCTGQISNAAFRKTSPDRPDGIRKIGGARQAAGLDAYRAMKDAIDVAVSLDKGVV